MTSEAESRKVIAGKYRLIREIGSGGMATVYLADDLKHQRQVAIKVMKPELASAIGHDRFLREIEIVARLNHPHVLPLFDSGADEGRLFYVMPYISGASLRARLDREKQLDLPEAVRLTREIASALGHAHRQGLVHRDIKPENVLLADGIALVADFGVARAMHAVDATDRTQVSTELGVMIGTPRYMSPEQVVGGTVDGRTDLYALACVAFEMLAGRPPFVVSCT
jgi:eukaryotic-like serine/threonine-protein kinase